MNNLGRISLLNKLIKEKGCIRIIEAHNGLSALIAGNAQVETKDSEIRTFDGFWESSLTDSSSKGLPDIEIVSLDSRLDTLNQILEVTNKPIIFDGDTGGDINQFTYMVRRLERMGVSMVIIEDKQYPKRNSFANVNHRLESISKFCKKIKHGQQVKQNKEFMIIARTESLIAGKPINEAITRTKAYLKAGADGIMIHSKSKDPSEILEFTKQFYLLPKRLIQNKILVCAPTMYNKITTKELAKAGFHIVIYANHQLRAASRAMEEICKNILIHDRGLEADSFCISVNKLLETVGFINIINFDTMLAQKNEL